MLIRGVRSLTPSWPAIPSRRGRVHRYLGSRREERLGRGGTQEGREERRGRWSRPTLHGGGFVRISPRGPLCADSSSYGTRTRSSTTRSRRLPTRFKSSATALQTRRVLTLGRPPARVSQDYSHPGSVCSLFAITPHEHRIFCPWSRPRLTGPHPLLSEAVPGCVTMLENNSPSFGNPLTDAHERRTATPGTRLLWYLRATCKVRHASAPPNVHAGLRRRP